MKGHPLVGSTIDGRWRLTEQIGRGAMGDIFRATDLQTGGAYALKLLHANLRETPELVARFAREIETTARIDHANAVRVRSWGQSREGQPYLVMDEIRGRTLSAIAAVESPMSASRVAHLGRQIAAGLGAAHAVGVVHRDLKPENIMVSRMDGRDHAVVFDFGLSLDRRGGPRLTEHDLRIGTPGYMAPEYLLDGVVDARADLYALGVVLYELASGEMPFLGPPYKVFQQQATREAPLLSARCGAPPWLSDAVAALVKRDPNERPPDADAAIGLLQEPQRA